MATDHVPFPGSIQKKALERQRFKCASCGTRILLIGEGFKAQHQFGERAEGHHLIPNRKGGPVTLDNCVVICRSCHISAHQGGQWADISIYQDLRGKMIEKIAEVAKLYPHYNG